MKSEDKGFSLIPIILLALVLAGGVLFAVNYIVNTEQPLEIIKPKTTPEAVEANSPQSVVEAFYTWYLSYEGNPLTDEAYKESPYLTPSFKNGIEQTLAGMSLGGADPVLCAQDKPQSFEVGAVSISGSTARVEVTQFFGNQRIVPVELRKIEGDWLISNVLCSEVETSERPPTAEQTVVLYYPNAERTPKGVTECGLVYGTEREVSVGDNFLEVFV